MVFGAAMSTFAGKLTVVNTTGSSVSINGESFSLGVTIVPTSASFSSHPVVAGMSGLTGSEDWQGGNYVYYITSSGGFFIEPEAGVNYWGAYAGGFGFGLTLFGSAWILRMVKRIPGEAS